MNAKPKPPLRTLVGTQPQRSVYFSAESNAVSTEIADFQTDEIGEDDHDSSNSDSEDDNDEDTDYETFNYLTEIELNTIVWPSIVGQMEIDEVEDDYIVVGSLKLPHGIVTIKDRLSIPV